MTYQQLIIYLSYVTHTSCHLICCLYIYLFGVLHCFQHCTGHITTGSLKGRGNQYIELVKVLYCKLPTNSKQLAAFPLETMPDTEPQPQRWEARVLPLCHCGPYVPYICLAQIVDLCRASVIDFKTFQIFEFFKTFSYIQTNM